MVSTGDDIDIATAEPFKEAILEAVSNSSRGVVLDLSQVRYVDSAGIRVVFELAERLDQRRQLLRLVVAPQGAVERVLSIVGLPAVVTIDESVDAAANAIETRPGRR